MIYFYFFTEFISFLLILISIHSSKLNILPEVKEKKDSSFYEKDELTGFFSSSNFVVVAGIIFNTNEYDWRTVKFEVFDKDFYLLFYKRIIIPRATAGPNSTFGNISEFRETKDSKYILTLIVEYRGDMKKEYSIVILRTSQDLNIIDSVQFNYSQIYDDKYSFQNFYCNTFLVDLSFSQKIYRVFSTDPKVELPLDSQSLHFFDIDITNFKILSISKFTEICCLSPVGSTEIKWIYLEKEIQKYYFLILQAYSKLSGRYFTAIFKNNSYGIEPYEVSYLSNYDYYNSNGTVSMNIFLSDIDTIIFTCFDQNHQYFFESPLKGLNPILKYTIEIPFQLIPSKKGFTYINDGKIYSTISLLIPEYNCLFYSFETNQVFTYITLENYLLFPSQSNAINDKCLEINNINYFNSSHLIFFEKDYIPPTVFIYANALKINLFQIQDSKIRTSLFLGGDDTYKSPKIFINYSKSSFLFYGRDKKGIYFTQISKIVPDNILNQNRFKLDGLINSYSVVEVNQGKIILIGNYIKDNLSFYPFIAEIDEFLYPEIIDGPSWANNFLITYAINLDASKFAVVGTKIFDSNSKCYFAEINGKYALLNEAQILIEGKTCKINAIILSLDLKIIGVGEISGDSSIIIFQIKPILSYYIVKNYRNVSLNTISQINSSHFLGAGIITDKGNSYPYYITFDYNLFPSSDISILEFISHNSNLIRIFKKLIMSANHCGPGGCLRFFSFVPCFQIIDELPFPSESDKNYAFSQLLYDNKTLFIYAIENHYPDPAFNFLYSSSSTITMNPNCPYNNRFNSNDGICYLDCLSPDLIDSYQCLEFDDKICTNCQLIPNSLISDLFVLYKYYTSDTKMLIIQDTIDFKTEDKMVSFKFNNRAIFYPFSMILSLITTDGNFTSYVQYEYYRIEGKSVQIMNIELPNNINDLLLKIDLTFLKIENPFGAPLLNSTLTIDLSEIVVKNESWIRKIIKSTSSFINNNQFFNLEMQLIQD